MAATESAPDPNNGVAWRGHWLPLAVLLLLTLFAYSNSLRGSFVFDDIRHIRENPLIRDLGNFVSSWTGYQARPNRYLAYFSFAFNYWLGGFNTTGYHLFNLCVHVVNTVLVYALVVITFRTPRLRVSALAPSSRSVAFLAASLFATHPLQTQAVSYIVQRLTSLASLFYLLTVVLYACWRLNRITDAHTRPRNFALFLLTLAATLAAVRTKEIAFTLPLAVVLYELCFFEGTYGRRLIPLLPLFAIAALIPFSVLHMNRPIGETLADASQLTRVQVEISRLDYLRTELAVIATYLRLLVYPAGQNLDHDFPLYRSFLDPHVFGSLLLLLVLVATAWILYRFTAPQVRRPFDPALRMVSFGVAWFFLALAVESSFIPIVDVIYEHRVYLPSVGFFIAVALIGGLLLRRFSQENPARAIALAGFMVALLLAALTLQRNVVWANNLSLWSDAVSKSPQKSRPHANLGTAFAEAGYFQEAISELRLAVSLDPDLAYAHAQLGAAWLALGNPKAAEPELRETLRLQPDDPEALFNLAMMLWNTGRREEARPWFQRFLDVAPNAPDHARRIATSLLKR